MRRALLLWLVLVALAGPAWAQNTSTRTLSVGPTPAPPSGTTVRLDGLGTVGGTLVLLTDLDGDVFERVLGKADLPASLAYEDEANTFALLQTFTSGLTSNGNVTVSGANDVILGTGGIRGPASNPLLIRNNTDAATVASFANTAITLSQPTTITGNLTIDAVTTTYAATLNAALTSGVYYHALFQNAGTSVGNITSTGTGPIINSLGAASALTLTTGTGGILVSANGPVRTGDYVSHTTGWAITPAGAGDFRYVYVDELHAKAFIADLEMALNGGQVIAKSTVLLAQAFTCPAAAGNNYLWARDFPGFPNIRAFAENDWVSLRSFSRTDADNDGNTDLTIGDCVGQVNYVGDGSGATEGQQQWWFTRGSGGSAGGMPTSTVVAEDAIVIDYGVSGQGFLVARSNDGPEGINSPYWQAVTWTTAPVAANMTLQTRWGNLNGSYGYTSATYGFAAGPSSGQWLSVDPTNGVRMMTATTPRVVLSPDGFLEIFNDAGVRQIHLSSTYGFVMGGSGRPAVSINTTSMSFCASSGTLCPFVLDGATGTITSTGSITIGSGGHIKGGATAYATGTGFWLGNDGGTYKFYIGEGTGATDDYLTWSGTALSVSGAITAVSNLVLGASANIVKGSGNLSISSTGVSAGLTLSAGGGAGTLTLNAGGLSIGGSTALTTTKTVRDSAGTGTCTLIFTLGSLTGGSC